MYRVGDWNTARHRRIGEAERAFAVSPLGTERLVFSTNLAGCDPGRTEGIDQLRGTLNASANRLFPAPNPGLRFGRPAPGASARGE